MLKQNNLDGKYYISSTINEIILTGKKVSYYEVEKGQYKSFYSPAKIKEYEDGKQEIKVGDIVRLKSAPEIEIWVTDISDEDGGRLSGLALKSVGDNCEIGATYAYREIYMFERTGKHYDVAAVLAKMKGES